MMSAAGYASVSMVFTRGEDSGTFRVNALRRFP